MLSLAVTTLEENDQVLSDLGRKPPVYNNIRTLATRFRGAAMKCLVADQFLVRRLSTLKALILLIYAISHSQGMEGSWALLGMSLKFSKPQPSLQLALCTSHDSCLIRIYTQSHTFSYHYLVCPDN